MGRWGPSNAFKDISKFLCKGYVIIYIEFCNRAYLLSKFILLNMKTLKSYEWIDSYLSFKSFFIMIMKILDCYPQDEQKGINP